MKIILNQLLLSTTMNIVYIVNTIFIKGGNEKKWHYMYICTQYKFPQSRIENIHIYLYYEDIMI